MLFELRELRFRLLARTLRIEILFVTLRACRDVYCFAAVLYAERIVFPLLLVQRKPRRIVYARAAFVGAKRNKVVVSGAHGSGVYYKRVSVAVGQFFHLLIRRHFIAAYRKLHAVAVARKHRIRELAEVRRRGVMLAERTDVTRQQSAEQQHKRDKHARQRVEHAPFRRLLCVPVRKER